MARVTVLVRRMRVAEHGRKPPPDEGEKSHAYFYGTAETDDEFAVIERDEDGTERVVCDEELPMREAQREARMVGGRLRKKGHDVKLDPSVRAKSRAEIGHDAPFGAGQKPLHGGFSAWLRRLYGVESWLHGAELVEENAKHAYGRFVSTPADADDDLRRAEALGWVVRDALAPTWTQECTIRHERGKMPTIYARCWYWVPAAADSDARREAQAWLEQKHGT